ncbi:general substrate transporter, partial [Karstenula rhodostoma CBS 690.94]
IGILAEIEDRPTPPSVYNWRVYVSAATASFASCMVGYTTSFIGTIVSLQSFKDEFGLSSLSVSQSSLIQANIVSLFQAGAFFGSIFAYSTAYHLGRRITLWTFVIMFIVGACVAFAAIGGHIGPMYAGRVISGFGVGGCTMIMSRVVPIYISEIAPPAIRGRLVGSYELGWQIGGLVGFWINYGMTQSLPYGRNQWLIPFAVQLIPAGIVLIGSLIFLCESPRWLWTRGRREEGVATLCWLRKLQPDDTYFFEEIEMMDLQIQGLPSGFLKPIRLAVTDSKVTWRLFLGHMLFVLQNFSGINAINYYSPAIFETMGVTSIKTVDLMTGLFGGVKCIMTILWPTVLIDKLGRRTLFLVGGTVGAACMFVIGALIASNSSSSTTDSSLSSQSIAISFSSTSGPVSTSPPGTAHRGSSTPRCSARRAATWGRSARA